MELNFKKRQSIAVSSLPVPGKLDPNILKEFDVERKKLEDEIIDLRGELDNQKDNVKNLKV